MVETTETGDPVTTTSKIHCSLEQPTFVFEYGTCMTGLRTNWVFLASKSLGRASTLEARFEMN